MSSGMIRLAVGERWPYPHPGGMQAIVDATEIGLSLALVLACDDPTDREMAALRDGPIRLAVMGAPPITWIALDAGALSYDAPYARGIASAGYARAIAGSGALIEAWPATARHLVEIYVLDRGLIAHMRVMTLSREWWQVLAREMARSPEVLDRALYQQTIAHQQARWTTADMIGRARIVETGGRV